MTRFSAPTPKRRLSRKTRLSVVAAGLVAAVGVGGFLTTSATFTDQASVENNSVTIGSIALGRPVTGTALAVEDLLPGDTVTPQNATLGFTNAGSTKLAYEVSIADLSITVPTGSTVDVSDLDKSLFTVTLTGADGATDAGTLAALPTLSGDLAAGASAKKEITVTVGLDQTAGNEWQGVKVVFALRVDASVAASA